MPCCTLRPALADDADFLLHVYAATRADELALTGWDDSQKQAFLRMQFQTQRRYYHEQFPRADYFIVVATGMDVGRWYVDRAPGVMRILDVALLPAWRGKGLGSELMAGLLTEAARTGSAVELHVEANNRALDWYRRLGFEEVGDAGIYRRMRWVAPVLDRKGAGSSLPACPAGNLAAG
jgi:ribosomal protein S18 acetylase RimI-like enzyme